jgi:hypothetical protein
MKTSIRLAALLERFFTQRLMQQRQASPPGRTAQKHDAC